MDLHQAKFLGIGFHERPDGWEMAAHFHPFHEMVVVFSGSQQVETTSGQITANPGDMMLYGAGLSHHEWSPSGTPLETCFFSFELPGLETPVLRRWHDHNGRVRQMLRWLYTDRANRGHLAEEERQALLQAILAEFFREPAETGEAGLVNDTRDFILTHLAEALSLDLLARQANLSKYHFLRDFRRRCGRTPMEEVRHLRAGYARDLILSSSLPLKAIAGRCGLGTEQAMCRMFRRLFRVTPGELRRFRRPRSPS